jgi:hypothetical protein
VQNCQIQKKIETVAGLRNSCDKISDWPAHNPVTKLSKPSKPSKPFQALPSPSKPKMSAATESLALDFSKMWSDDPIMKALWDGTMKWGDIPGILDNKPSQRRDSVSSSESEPDILTICSHKRRVAFAEKPAVKEFPKDAPLPERVVPAYTPGIKTVITRNLPRDIRVEQLRGVFEKYGPIKDIYIPKNMDKSSPYFGTIKGFALIKFLKPADSAQAYESEYGRLTIGKNNITVEFAKEDR